MPFYVALLRIRPFRVVTRPTQNTVSLKKKHTTKHANALLQQQQQQTKPSTQQQQQQTTTITQKPPVETVTQSFLNLLNDGGAIIRAVRYGGNRPLPIPIRVLGSTHYFADFASIEFVGHPNMIPEILRKSKAEKDLFRVNVLRADDVLGRILQTNDSRRTS
jgi:ribosomal protein S6